LFADNTAVTASTSKFYKASDVLDILDEAWEKIKLNRQNVSHLDVVESGGGFVVDMKRNIGRNLHNTADTQKVQIYLDSAAQILMPDTSVISTIFPK